MAYSTQRGPSNLSTNPRRIISMVGSSQMSRFHANNLGNFAPNYDIRKGSSCSTITKFMTTDGPAYVVNDDPKPDAILMLICGNDIAYLPQHHQKMGPTDDQIIQAFLDGANYFHNNDIIVMIVPIIIRTDTVQYKSRVSREEYDYRMGIH